MGRAPCCDKVGLRRGRWTTEEDQILSNYIQTHGEGSWRSLPKNAGLLRCGKSCRLRWINYLRSDVKRGNISAEEEDTIVKLHASLGNRWSLIAGHLAGRTDNEIKNYWNSHLSRKIIPSFSKRSHQQQQAPPIPILTNLKRRSPMKIKKPNRKTTSTLAPEQMEKEPNNMNYPSGHDGGIECCSSLEEQEREKELKDCFDEIFYEAGLLMEEDQEEDPTASGVLSLSEQREVVEEEAAKNSRELLIGVESGCGSSDSNYGKQEVDWNWDIITDHTSMELAGLGAEEQDNNNILSWPWDSLTQNEDQIEVLGMDIEKQDAIIAWLLS